LDESEEWSEKERLQGEKETLGLYLTGHPIGRYEAELSSIVTARIGNLSGVAETGNGGGRRKGGPRVTVAGLVLSIRQIQTQRGRMASLVLDDRSGRIEVTLFSDVFEDNRELLAVDKVLVVAGGLSFDDFRGGLNIRVDQVFDFEQVREARARHLLLTCDYRLLDEKGVSPDDFNLKLKQVLETHRGGSCPVRMTYQRQDAKGDIDLGPEWQVHPTDELLIGLERVLGQANVGVVYGARHQGD
jgi:DNA polymerase-3 subunit alpha